MDIETEKTLKLYELAQDEERFYIEGHSKKVAYWTSFIATIFGATTVGVLKATNY